MYELQIPIEKYRVLRLNPCVSISHPILHTPAQTDLQHLARHKKSVDS